VWRVVESKSRQRIGRRWREVVHYCDHHANPDSNPPLNECESSTYDEVKAWHAESADRLSRVKELKPRTVMQDTDKTIEIYEAALYPFMREHRLTWLVEDNASPHANDRIRVKHVEKGINLVGYTATESDKQEIVRLITVQTRNYRRDQDRRAQITKQTRELDRLPAWPPNSPDLNLIEIIWSWMVKSIARTGWPTSPDALKAAVLQAWDDVSLESIRQLMMSYRIRLMCIESTGGDRHPDFA